MWRLSAGRSPRCWIKLGPGMEEMKFDMCGAAGMILDTSNKTIAATLDLRS